MRYVFTFFIFLIHFISFSQNPSSSREIKESINQQNQLIENSIVKNLKFENIGPSVMSGRVTDIEVNPNKTTCVEKIKDIVDSDYFEQNIDAIAEARNLILNQYNLQLNHKVLHHQDRRLKFPLNAFLHQDLCFEINSLVFE